MKKTRSTEDKNELEIEPGAYKFSLPLLLIRSSFRLIFFLVVLMALLGLFGTGLLSTQTLRQGALAIQFEKYGRIQSTNIITINVSTALINRHEFLPIKINTSLQNNMMIKSMSPRPAFESSDNNKIIYYFKMNPNSTQFNLVIVTEPFKIGLIKHNIGIVNDQSISFNQFIYP